MRTLYVSDLDGTLFNSDESVSDYSAGVLNRCLDKGMLFTVATARMPYDCDARLASIRLNTPAILTNGVFLYEFSSKTFVGVESIPDESAAGVVEAFRKNGASCFLYTYSGGKISLFFEDERMKEQEQYYSDRARESCREVSLVPDCLEKLAGGRTVYAGLTGPEDELKPIRDSLDEVPGVAAAFYLNVYNGFYCLEAHSDKASKKNALTKLKKIVDYDELVVFGDNHNDIAMIEAADRSYAPENALPEVKERVTAVLDSNDNDGVAKFLASEMKLDA